MSWASERLMFLHDKYSYRQIREITGIPESTISYVMRDERVLPSRYIINLKTTYTREAYRSLRAAGLQVALSDKYKWYTPMHVLDMISSASKLVRQLSEYRLPQYIEYLKSHNRYTTDSEARKVLESSIKKSLSRSIIRVDDDTWKDSPSLRHII